MTHAMEPETAELFGSLLAEGSGAGRVRERDFTKG